MTGLNPRVDRSPARAFRAACRRGEFRQPTCGHAAGFVQANLVALPRELAFDFLLFCQRNPKPCPLLDVTEPGDPEPKRIAPGADLRTDVPKYRVFQRGELVAEVDDAGSWWRDDLVGFLLGCSFTFESALLAAGLEVRHLTERNVDGSAKNVPMYRTNIPCEPAGMFRGPMVVSMRPYRPADAIRAAVVTSRFPRAHGAPIHSGDPQTLGIADLSRPDYGDPVTIHSGEVPVFWACGVTPQAVVAASKPAFCITHAPGHMFVADLTDAELQDG
jgi:uncharacterized protein YcsI (UPF0317 family)